MRFALLFEGTPDFWTGHCTFNGQDIFTNDPRPLGWKEVDDTPPEQKEGYYVVYDGWEEVTDIIRQTYHYEPIPEPEESLEERVSDVEESVLELSEIGGE